MTLTDLLPTLRRTLPAPFRPDHWPAQTHPTPDDVCLAGVSMRRFAELCDTPCVHGAAAVIPGTGGRLSPQEECSIVVTRIVAGEAGEAGGWRMDAALAGIPADWVEARPIGRVFAGRPRRTPLFDADGVAVAAVELPGDIGVGDLLAVPCRLLVVHRQLLSETAGVRS